MTPEQIGQHSYGGLEMGIAQKTVTTQRRAKNEVGLLAAKKSDAGVTPGVAGSERIRDAPITRSDHPAVQLDRWSRIQRRAYEIAEQRGFGTGAQLDDWLQAEKEIDAE
ncbi:MAG: DUF2934 domain-containing protein [Steroidobacteraceae bacterium]